MFSCLCSPPTNVVAKSNVTLLYPGSGAGPWPGGPPELLGQHTGLRGRSVPHIRPELSDAVEGGASTGSRRLCFYTHSLLYPRTVLVTPLPPHTDTRTPSCLVWFIHTHSHAHTRQTHKVTGRCTHRQTRTYSQTDTEAHKQTYTFKHTPPPLSLPLPSSWGLQFDFGEH